MGIIARGPRLTLFSMARAFLWRGSLLPLGREAAPWFCLTHREGTLRVQREQAPSPQQLRNPRQCFNSPSISAANAQRQALEEIAQQLVATWAVVGVAELAEQRAQFRL